MMIRPRAAGSLRSPRSPRNSLIWSRPVGSPTGPAPDGSTSLANGHGCTGRSSGGLGPAAAFPLPAGLLVAAEQTVSFVHRPELDGLLEWCEDPDAGQGLVGLVHAPGGAGKTRLAVRLCDVLTDRGWIAGFLTGTALGEAGPGIDAALGAGFPVLAVVDYAQDRLPALRALLARIAVATTEGAPVRVLLLARSPEPWWEALLADDDADAWILGRARAVSLGALTESVPAVDLAEQAFGEFARVLGHTLRAPPAELRDADRLKDHSVLELHAQAMDAVITLAEGGVWHRDADPIARICQHEQRIWRGTLKRYVRAGSHWAEPPRGVAVGPITTVRAVESDARRDPRRRLSGCPGRGPNAYESPVQPLRKAWHRIRPR